MDSSCSSECLSQEKKPKTADDSWHDLDCPNHSFLCCGVNDPPKGDN